MERKRKITKLKEDDLKILYFSDHCGTSFTEVSVGTKKSNKNSTDRRIDIVRIENGHHKEVCKYGEHKDSFKELVNENLYNIELVEAKVKLNRPVIGQIIVGEYLFKRKFGGKNVSKAIVYHVGDELLEGFCGENGIRLIRY